ncbi:hypothetical protein EDC96DRAFT_570174 [Choanephora cucurbitarum]|nr:hypothetical protein EDC96DRAFT_570174 [Choanephora cucurbitarum]
MAISKELKKSALVASMLNSLAELPALRHNVTLSSGPSISKPAPKDLDDTDKLYARRLKFFLPEWLQDQVTIQLFDLTSVKLGKEALLDMQKKFIQGLAAVAVEKMIIILEAGHPNWALQAYGCSYISSVMATMNGIPTDRCTNLWLEDMLLEYFYHNRQQSKKRKLDKQRAQEVQTQEPPRMLLPATLTPEAFEESPSSSSSANKRPFASGISHASNLICSIGVITFTRGKRGGLVGCLPSFKHIFIKPWN